MALINGKYKCKNSWLLIMIHPFFTLYYSLYTLENHQRSLCLSKQCLRKIYFLTINRKNRTYRIATERVAATTTAMLIKLKFGQKTGNWINNEDVEFGLLVKFYNKLIVFGGLNFDGEF